MKVAAISLSPNQRAWVRFKRNKLGYCSLWLFGAMLVLATFAEVFSNDKPFLAHIAGQWWAPAISNPPEHTLGGDFYTPTDWKDPLVATWMAQPGNW